MVKLKDEKDYYIYENELENRIVLYYLFFDISNYVKHNPDTSFYK